MVFLGILKTKPLNNHQLRFQTNARNHHRKATDMNAKFLIPTILFSLFLSSLHAQFIDKGVIEFEVRTNIKKTMGSSSWAESMKDKMPDFKTCYFIYTFSDQSASYKFDRWDKKESTMDFFRQSDEKSEWYTNFKEGYYNMKKEVFGSTFNIKDSLRNIKWKLTNENRIIAGYNCRKAIGVTLDSIYVFAFYTDEIVIPGGPATIHGLPGMILGLTIPRLYTSWIATKVKSYNNDAPIISSPEFTKNIWSTKTAIETIKEKTKDWGNSSDPESKKWIDQLVWNLIL